MKLFYKPAACSMASHIALHEIGDPFEIEAVDTVAGTTETGTDYATINPKGYVPALQIDDGDVLTEGPAILQFLADRRPERGLIPEAGTTQRARMSEALTFISSELHKAFGPLFRDGIPPAEQDAARINVATKLDHVETLLSDGRETLLPGQFTIADIYLFVVANWSHFTGIDLARWPNLAAFVTRTAARPATQAAMQAEGLA